MRRQCGNVLFLILIAVALFAALSYAVTYSSRTGDSSITNEKAKIYAAQITQFGTQLENAVMRMRINNIPIYGIDFSSPNTAYPAANGTCTNDLCKMFNVNGGGVEPITFDDRMFDTTLIGAGSAGIFKKYVLRSISVLEIGSDEDDLVLLLHSIDQKICSQINRKNGIIDSGNPPTEVFSGFTNYSGTLTSFPTTTGEMGGPTSPFRGKRSFCGYFNATWGYIYYHVILAR